MAMNYSLKSGHAPRIGPNQGGKLSLTHELYAIAYIFTGFRHRADALRLKTWNLASRI